MSSLGVVILLFIAVTLALGGLACMIGAAILAATPGGGADVLVRLGICLYAAALVLGIGGIVADETTRRRAR